MGHEPGGAAEGVLGGPPVELEVLRGAERALVALRVPEHVARLIAATPSLRASWALAVGSILILAAVGSSQTTGPTPFLVLAPLLPLAGVAAAYGPAADPIFEITRAAPMSSFRMILIRATAVLAATSLIAAIGSVLAPADGWRIAAWILPSLAVTIAGLTLGTFMDPLRAAIVVAGVWVAGVIVVWRVEGSTGLFGGTAQAAYAAVAIAGAVVIVRRRDRFEMEQRAVQLQIVTAADAERRRLERNLHDGAQQQLVAVAIKLGLTRKVLEHDQTAAMHLLTELEADVRAALDDLRELARGLNPPVLTEQGLVSALEAHIGRHGLPAMVDAARIGRYAPEIEATIYFCCLEALQNVAKYARAERVLIHLSEAGNGVGFVVRDDGVGFDVSTMKPGSGLRNMQERLHAFGGSLRVESASGRGTVISGELPAR